MNHCGRFQVLAESLCRHLSPLDPDPFWMMCLSIVPVAVGFFNATGFGNSAVQIFILIIFLNYGRKASAYLAQPLSAGVFIATSIQNVGKKHPQIDAPLIDYRLALMITPNLITGLIAGIHFKHYLPSLIVTIFFIFQLLVLITSTKKKHKQRLQIEEAQRKVDEQKRLDLLAGNTVQLDDGEYIDFERISQLVQNSPNKEQYLKLLPQDIKDLMNEEQSFREKLKEQYGPEKLKKFQEKLERELKQRYTPKVYLLCISTLVIVNLLILLFKGFSDRNHCITNYWPVYGLQVFLCSVVFFFFVAGSRSIVEIMKLWIVSFMSGFLLGLVGMGVAMFLVITLVKLRVSLGGFQSIAATLPILLAITTITGSLIQVIIGATDIYSTLLFGIFGYVGQRKINPYATDLLKKNNYLGKSTKFALIFQQALLVLYVGLQIPKIIKTPILDQLSPRPYCLQFN